MNKNRILSSLLCLMLLCTAISPAFFATSASETLQALFTVTNSFSGQSGNKHYYCNYAPQGYVDTEITVHNPDGQSFLFGCNSGNDCADYPYMQAKGNFNTSANKDAAKKAKATVVVVTADESNTATYPLGFKWDKVRILGSSTTMVTIASDGNITTQQVSLETGSITFLPGSTNYLITTVSKSTDLSTVTTNFNLCSGYNAHNYDGCNFYIDSVGVTDDPDELMDTIKKVCKPDIGVSVTSSDRSVLLTWKWLKDGMAAEKYKAVLFDENGTVIQTKIVETQQTGFFLSADTAYRVRVEALDSSGHSIGKSVSYPFKTSAFPIPYKVTNSMETVSGTFSWVSDWVKNCHTISENPSLYHPDGKYTAFELNGEKSVELYNYTGFNAQNAKNAHAVIYSIEGGTDLKKPDGADELTFFWSGGALKDNIETLWVVAIDKATGKRTLVEEKEGHITVLPGTINYVVMLIKDGCDITSAVTDAHLWNADTYNGYTGTVYLDDFGVADDAAAVLTNFMAPESADLKTPTGDLLFNVTGFSSFMRAEIVPFEGLNVAEYHLKLFSVENYQIFHEIRDIKLESMNCMMPLSADKVYAVQVLAYDNSGKAIAASAAKGFTTTATDISVTAESRVTTADIKWSIPDEVPLQDKFDVCWYEVTAGKPGEMVAQKQVTGTNSCQITELFPEKTYLVKVFGYQESGERNEYPGTAQIIMGTALSLTLTPNDTSLEVVWSVSSELLNVSTYQVILSEINQYDEWKPVQNKENVQLLETTFTDLLPLQNYGVTVVALDASGKELTPICSDSVTTNTRLTATYESTLKDITVSWKPDSSLTDISYYEVKWYSVTEINQFELLKTIETETAKYKFENLPQGTKYACQISAHGNNGELKALSNRLIAFTKAPVLYQVTNDMSGSYSVYYSNFNDNRYIKNEVSMYHPDGNYVRFGTNGSGGGTWPYFEVNTYFNSENTSQMDAMVFELRADSANTSEYPIWLNPLGDESTKYQVSVVTFDAQGNKYLTDWEIGKTKAFEAGSMNYIIIKSSSGSNLSSLNRIRFGSGYAQNDYSGCTYYFDDLGVTENAIRLMMDLLNVPEYHFYPISVGNYFSVTSEYEATWVQLNWNPQTLATRYVINLYNKKTDGSYLLVDSIQTSELSKTYSSLLPLSAYTVQILALDCNGNVISASKPTEFTTVDRNKPIYLKGPLDAEKGYYPNSVLIYDGALEARWNHIGGVSYYIAVLYKKQGNSLVYVDHKTSEEDCFVSFDDINDSEDYYVQIILYDLSDSVVLAFEPMSAKLIPMGIRGDTNFESFDTGTVFESDDTANENEPTKKLYKKLKKVIITEEDGYSTIFWIVIISCIVLAVVGGTVTTIIIIRKRHRKRIKPISSEH